MAASLFTVVGDVGIERYVYSDRLQTGPLNEREAWMRDANVRVVKVAGQAGQVARLLDVDGADMQPAVLHGDNDRHAESVYLLANSAEEGRTKRWTVHQAVVSGEGEFCQPDVVRAPGDHSPLVVVDYRNGWLHQNWKKLPGLLRGRPYLIRPNDPYVTRLGAADPKYWSEVLAPGAVGKGIFFCPREDMADGALRVSGGWRTVCAAIRDYLVSPPTECGPSLYQGQHGWTQCLVVQIALDGAMILGPENDETTLVFPGDQPGSFYKRVPGTVFGGGVVIVSHVADALLPPHTDRPLHRAVVSAVGKGLTEARRLVSRGYVDSAMAFERRSVLHAKRRRAHSKAVVLPAPLDDSYALALKVLETDSAALGRMIAYRVGELTTPDPEFAEQLIRLGSRIEAHLAPEAKGVLSIAVFGGPGSGKSFAIEQVAGAPSGRLCPLRPAFNVSQFSGPEALIRALDEVRDVSRTGSVPLVQFDEFDCSFDGRRGGWLSRFLMPMQDAKYLAGTATKDIGKCIFVFLGGTWGSAGEFLEWASDDETGTDLKGLDFHSRLDRILEIPSIDLFDSDTGQPTTGRPLLTRAMLLRSQLAEVDLVCPHVAEFLLRAPLLHGVRSLNSIVAASDLKRTRQFCVRHLPPDEMLRVHVRDLGRWRKLMSRPPPGPLLKVGHD